MYFRQVYLDFYVLFSLFPFIGCEDPKYNEEELFGIFLLLTYLIIIVFDFLGNVVHLDCNRLCNIFKASLNK